MFFTLFSWHIPRIILAFWQHKYGYLYGGGRLHTIDWKSPAAQIVDQNPCHNSGTQKLLVAHSQPPSVKCLTDYKPWIPTNTDCFLRLPLELIET